MRSGEKIKLTSYDELLGAKSDDSSVEVSTARISAFINHPFKVEDDARMDMLVESIRQYGILSPVLLRPGKETDYEMVSGHRRLRAAQIIGMETIPAIIRDMTDDEATIAMVDANIQREELLPSEKAAAYKMKLEAMKRQGERTDLSATSAHDEQKLSDGTSRDILAKQMGMSGVQLSRYIRLTELVPELLDMVDKKRLAMTVAVELSYLEKEVQSWVGEYLREGGKLRKEQLAALRAIRDRSTTKYELMQLLRGEAKERKRRLFLSERTLNDFFPEEYTEEMIEDTIKALLKKWKESGAKMESNSDSEYFEKN